MPGQDKLGSEMGDLLNESLRTSLTGGSRPGTSAVEPEIVDDLPEASFRPIPVSLRVLTDDEIWERFNYHPPSTEGAGRHQELSSLFVAIARRVDDICPPGREKSLAFTKLEEAKMWASAAVARNTETR